MCWWLPPLLACWWRAGVNALLEPLLGGWLACRAPERCGDTLAHQTPVQPVRDPLDCTGLHNFVARSVRVSGGGRKVLLPGGNAPLRVIADFFPLWKVHRDSNCSRATRRWRISKALEVVAATYSGSYVLHNELNTKEGHYWCAKATGRAGLMVAGLYVCKFEL